MEYNYLEQRKEIAAKIAQLQSELDAINEAIDNDMNANNDGIKELKSWNKELKKSKVRWSWLIGWVVRKLRK